MADSYRPLSERRGLVASDGPAEGVPDHLRGPLLGWVDGLIGINSVVAGWPTAYLQAVAALGRIPTHSGEPYHLHNSIVAHCERSDDGFLDVLDALLHATDGRTSKQLRVLLEQGGSVWTVATDGRRLERRVTPSAATALEAAVSTPDKASGELMEAWSKAYGRQPDPSDSWDHSIKAVETVLAPIVVPANSKATLGTIIAALDAKPSKWRFGLGTGAASVETLTAMLRLMWPNPDRHGGNAARPPTAAEASAVVQMAVTIVQWCRSGVVS